jgi:hypothetical protein
VQGVGYLRQVFLGENFDVEQALSSLIRRAKKVALVKRK